MPEPEHSYEIAPFNYSVDMYLDTSLVKSKPSLQNQSIIPRTIQRQATVIFDADMDKEDIPDKNGDDDKP